MKKEDITLISMNLGITNVQQIIVIIPANNISLQLESFIINFTFI